MLIPGAAIKAGYRPIDTAAFCSNEDALGDAVREAVKEGLCSREDLFIASKLWVQDMRNYDVILRWNVERGVSAIPKSTHKERIEENFLIRDSSLSEDETEQISSLDQGYVGPADKHFSPDLARGCINVKIH